MPTASPSSVLSPAKKIKKAASRPAIRPGGILVYILNVHRRGSRWQPAFFSTPFPFLLQKRKRILRPHSFFLYSEKEKNRVAPPRKERDDQRTFRMVLWTLHRPEPCSGLAAYGSRKCTIEFVGADEGIGPYKVRREVELRGFTNRPREAQSPVHPARRGCRPPHFGG